MDNSEKDLTLHRESIISDGLEISNWSRYVYENMHKGGLTAVNATVVVLENFVKNMENLAWWHKALEESSDLICHFKTVADIKQAKKNGKTGIIFGFQNISSIEDDLDRLTTFHILAVRVLQVTYMEANHACQGFWSGSMPG